MVDRKKHVEELIDGAQFLRRKASGSFAIKETGITGSQWLVVGHISRNEGCTTNEVAQALTMTGSAATQLINGLVSEGYVKRQVDIQDRRSHRLVLSAASKKRMSEFKKERMRMMLKMFQVLSDAEFATYTKLNKKILDSMRTN